jgi:cytochrome b561
MSPVQSTPEANSRYTSVAIFLHWVMAVGVVALVVVGLTMTHVKLPLLKKFQLYQLHKSIGITILLAAFVRLGWRLTHRPPPLPAQMTKLERTAAEGGHLVLYGFLFGLPLTGWALVSASVLSLPTVLYGVLPWPHLPVLSTLDDKAPVEAFLKQLHAVGAWLLITVIVGHTAAALQHHVIQSDGVLLRMLPGWGRRSSQIKLSVKGTSP